MRRFWNNLVLLIIIEIIPSRVMSYNEAKIIPILKQTFKQTPDLYSFSYETANGIHMQETGFFKYHQSKHPILVKTGSYRYVDDHGRILTVSYVADENGFQPFPSFNRGSETEEIF